MFAPVTFKWRIDYAVVSRSVVEAILIGYDADMTQAIKENKSSKLVLLFRSRS